MIRLGLFRAGVWLAERLPAPLLYRLAGAVGRLLSGVPSAPRARLRRNLSHVLGVPPHSPAITPYVRQAYQTQAANYLDLLRARVMTPQEVAQRVVEEGDGWDAFDRALAGKRGLVLVTAHFGRVELLNQHLGRRGVPVTLPLERLQPPALFELLRSLRTRPGMTLVPHDAGLRPCLRALARGEVAAFFADWDPTGTGAPVRFFGAPARLPKGPALVALRANVPLFAGFSLPGGRPGRVKAVMEPPLPLARTADFDADVQRATQLIAGAFERRIREHPGQWVMFHEIWPGGVVECGPEAPVGAAQP